MKLTSLTVENFRCFEGQVWPLTEPRILVIGENATGKSSMLDAIRWCLTGRCRGLDAAGKGARGLLRSGAEIGSSMSVTVEFDHGGKPQYRATRTLSYDPDKDTGPKVEFKVKHWQGSSADQLRAFEERVLGMSASNAAVVLDGELFFTLAHLDAKTLLLDLLDVKIPDPERPDDWISVKTCEKRYDAAFESRADIKRSIKALPAKTSAPEPLQGSIEDVRTRLDALKAELDRLKAERSTLIGQAKGAKGQAEQEFERLTAKAADLKTRLDAKTTQGWSDETLRKRIAWLERHIAGTNEEITRIAMEQAADPQDPDEPMLDEQIERLKGHDPKNGCVLCKDVECRTPVKLFKDVAKAIGSKQKTLMGEQQNRASRDANLEGYKAGLKSAEQELREKTIDLETIAALTADYESVTARLDELSTQVSPVEPAKPDTSVLDSQIEELQSRVTKGAAVLEGKVAKQAELKLYERQEAQRAELETQLKEAERQVETYGANGLRESALKGAIVDFEGKVNSVLDGFGYNLKVSFEPFELVVNNHRFVMLSASEKLRVTMALQCALAQISGLGLTLLDQMDMLLKAPRRTLQGLVMAMPLETIVLAKSQEPDQNPSIAGVQTIRLS